ncbi:hypothetical protein BH24ACT22_BH24ACT22_15090 [soil metagenome]
MAGITGGYGDTRGSVECVPSPERERKQSVAQADKSEAARRHAEKAGDKAEPWVNWIARIGYVAKGTVYAAVGVLAGQAALGRGGKTTGAGGAIESIGEQTFGKVVLVLLALGLVGYALWKLVQGIMDPDEKGSEVHGIVRRVAYGGSALIHLGLAFSAAEELLGSEGQSTNLDQWTAWAMSYQPPLGHILIGLVGLGVISVGLYQFYAGATARFESDLKTHHMSEAAHWTMLTGRIGTVARAIVILIAGSFVLLAALQSDPKETRGLGGALEAMVQQPYGPYLLGIVAVGLITYGFFMLVVARYRNIEAS